MTRLNGDINGGPVRIISCGVFRPAIERLKLTARFPGLDVSYLRSSLHNDPHKLKYYLMKEIISLQKSNARIICLYGQCFQDIDVLCRQYGVIKMEGHHCYEIFLGREKFREIMAGNAKTYFLEQDLVLNFEEYCVKPLELYDREMKESFFKNYERLVYVRQPSDPGLMPAVKNIADLLGLSVMVYDADCADLEKALIDAIGYLRCGSFTGPVNRS